MDVVQVDLRAGVYLRKERFDLICRILGHTSDTAVGRFIGMTDKTVKRARDGILGEAFIASVLRAISEHQSQLAEYGIGVRFEDVFEIRDKQVVSS